MRTTEAQGDAEGPSKLNRQPPFAAGLPLPTTAALPGHNVLAKVADVVVENLLPDRLQVNGGHHHGGAAALDVALALLGAGVVGAAKAVQQEVPVREADRPVLQVLEQPDALWPAVSSSQEEKGRLGRSR